MVTIHGHCLHWLMPTGRLFQSAFCRSCKFTASEIVPMEGLIWQWGPDIAPTVSMYLSRPYSGIFAQCGYMWMSQPFEALMLRYLCCPTSLFQLLPPSTPISIYADPKFVAFLEKSFKNSEINYYLFVRLVVQSSQITKWPILRRGWFSQIFPKQYFSKYRQVQTRLVFTEIVTDVLII